MSSILPGLWQALMPGICSFCDGPLTSLVSGLCPHCDRIRTQVFNGHLREFRAGKQEFMLLAGARYRAPVTDWIKRFKFGNSRAAGRHLAQGMEPALRRQVAGNPLWVPVPLPAVRRMRRVYNQAELLADWWQKKLGGKLARNLVRTRMFRPGAATLDADRRHTLSHGFSVNPVAVKQLDLQSFSEIIVVDDIFTTGTTIGRLASVLSEQFPDIPLSAAVLAIA